MTKRMIWLGSLLSGILLLTLLAWGAYREISIRNSEELVEYSSVSAVTKIEIKAEQTIEATAIPATETATPEPENPWKEILGSGMPVGVIVDRGDGYAVTSVWGTANFYRAGVSPEESMSYSTNGIETSESANGVLFTQVHSGFYYDAKLFAADIVNYVWSSGMNLSEGQNLVKGLIGKTVLLCQSTDGTFQPLQQVDVTKKCPNQKVFRISAAAIIDHGYVEAYSEPIVDRAGWMSDYEAAMGEFSYGYGDQTKEEWIISTCLNQYNDQPSDGNSILYGRLVIGLEYLGE